MKLLYWLTTTGSIATALALGACGGSSGGGGSGGGGSGGGNGCTSNAQCGAGQECVLSTASAPTSSPADFGDDEGFGGSDSFGGSGGDDGFGGSGGDDGFGGSGDSGSGGSGDPGSGGSGTPSGTCQPVSGSGGSSGGSGGSSGSGGTGGGTSCSSDFITGSTFYKGSTAFGECDNTEHPQNCQFGYFILTSQGCVCTAPCNSGNLPKVGEACSTDGSWVCQTLQNSNGSYDMCTHSGLNLCTAG